jgi:hypothetical protein
MQRIWISQDVKEECEDKNRKIDADRCEFDPNIMIEKQFEIEEVRDEIKYDTLYPEIYEGAD